MDKIIFNAKMINDDECTQAIVAPLVDDYLNHLTLTSSFPTIREYANAVVLTSEQYDGNQLMLVLVANSYDCDRTVGIVNLVGKRLEDRIVSAKYDDMRAEAFDCTPYLTRENEEYVMSLRNDVVENILDDNYKYCYVTKGTRKKIMDGMYKVPSRYEIQVNFMNVVRGVTAMPTRREIKGEDLECELTDEELKIIHAKVPSAFHRAESHKKHKPYIKTLDGKQLDAEEFFKSVDSDEELIEEMLARPMQQHSSTRTRQTSMDEFMR